MSLLYVCMNLEMSIYFTSADFYFFMSVFRSYYNVIIVCMYESGNVHLFHIDRFLFFYVSFPQSSYNVIIVCMYESGNVHLSLLCLLLFSLSLTPPPPPPPPHPHPPYTLSVSRRVVLMSLLYVCMNGALEISIYVFFVYFCYLLLLFKIVVLSNALSPCL